MRIIGVASHGNGAGKTLLLERMLEAWPGRFGAVKFTTIFRNGQFCPKDVQRRCACSRLHGDMEVIDDAETLRQPGTDTGRIHAAGAHPLLWCLAREGSHARAWEHARTLLEEDAELLTEGNTALSVVPTQALLFVVNPCVPRKTWKRGWEEIARRADVVVVNESPEGCGRKPVAPPAAREEALAKVQETCPATPRVVARLGEPFRDWAGPLLEDLLERRG